MLSGPEVSPKNNKPPKKLIVLLHGLGADGENLIDLADFIGPAIQDAHFIAPNAPFRFDQAEFGYQWFSRQNATEESAIEGLKIAEPMVNEFLDHHMMRFDLKDSNVALIGFSQGSMVALHTALRRKHPLALVVGFSGALIYPQKLKDEMKSKPPVTLVHGDDDEVLPISLMKKAELYLKQVGVEVEAHELPHLGHSINQTGLDIATERLRFFFNKIDHL